MSGEWLPVLVVLAIGSLAGLAMAWWMRRNRRASAADEGTADAGLRLKDLERRKRELYERLEREEDVADRRLLEDQAARVLREIDRLRGELPAATLESSEPPSTRDTEAAAPAAATGRSMLIGFLGGAAMVALVAVLIFWAGQDARPRDGMQAPGPAPMGEEEHPAPAMTADVAARIDGLRERVEANPSDLVARKQLALALLAAEQYFEAFEMAQQILASRPNDPDALYVQGMVRMTMGQDEMALESLDRVLEQYPNHVLALAGRGMIFMRGGDREAAVLIWERALEAAGGSHPDLEDLLALARAAPSAETEAVAETPAPVEILPPTAAPNESDAPPATPSDLAADVPSDTYRVEIDVQSGFTAPSGATLFVFLRQAAQGPPAAVKRIQSPVFPLRVELGPQDSMLGRPLPEAGVVTARLDADGSASTQSAGDLVAEAEARVGEAVRLSLAD